MNRDIIRLDKYTFKFEDIDLIYPVYIRDKSGEKYYSLYRVLSSSNYSRRYQLDHRSTQAQYFDLLLDLDHFKLLGINYNFITEMVLINTRPDIDSTRSYYLLDYFIPDLSLCIELDSDYHDPIKDKLKDKFLASIGIDVYRIYNFQINTKSKLNSLVEYIKEKKEMKFELSYESLIEECRYYLDNKDELDYEKRLKEDPLIVLSNKWRPVVEKLDKTILPGILNDIISKRFSTRLVMLNDIFEVIPFVKKESRKYYPLINYLRKLNINLTVLTR